ncbi:MAG: hypothetical protein AAGG80_06405, partial [Pseudomonadota bacterium]
MKKYIWPLILSAAINLSIIFAIFHWGVKHNTNEISLKSAVDVNLSSFAHHSHDMHHAGNQNQLHWLQQHYGKAIAIKRAFKAGQHLKGYVVSLKSNPQERSIIYSINGGKYYFMGTIIDNQGKNISQANAHKYITSIINKSIYQAAVKLPGIVHGRKKAPQAIIIIDPNSNLFPQQWNGLNYDIAQGMFSVKWVLVNYLKPMGPDIASDILQSKDPIAAMDYNANHYNAETQTGGYVKNLSVPYHIKNILRNNWNFVQ